MPPVPRECKGHHRLRCARCMRLLSAQPTAAHPHGTHRAGFAPKRTFIFSDFGYMGGEFYKNCVRIAKVCRRSAVCPSTRV